MDSPAGRSHRRESPMADQKSTDTFLCVGAFSFASVLFADGVLLKIKKG